MSEKDFLSVFSPNRTPTDVLEKIFVQREDLLVDAVARVRESATTENKHHLLFAGPRGSGKTHFVTLLVHRLGLIDDFEESHLHIAWLNEDETSTTILELLLKVHAALQKRYPDHYKKAALEPAFDLKAEDALELVKQLLFDKLENRTLLVVLENLDALFDGLGDSGQKQLRALVQENPVFSIVATAQALVDDLTNRSSPFFGFFQTEHMRPLSLEEAAELLEKIARHNAQLEVVAFLSRAQGRSRVRALHHLSGGNHRIYVVLAQFINRDNIAELVVPFQKMVDELTPYYQERVRWLPPLQRKIVEFLCKSENTVPVKNLARQLFATHQTVSNQLKELRQKGYVRSVQRGRESLYEVAEPLMRLCVEVKENQNYEPLRLLVDFIRVWYDENDMSARLQSSGAETLAGQYFKAAIEKSASRGNLRQELIVEDVRNALLDTQGFETSKVNEFCTTLDDCPEELVLALDCLKRGGLNEASELLAAEMQLSPAALFFRASLYKRLGDSEKAIADYTAAIEFEGTPAGQVAKALYNRGVIYFRRQDFNTAQNDFKATIALAGTPTHLRAEAYYAIAEIEGTRRHWERCLSAVCSGLDEAYKLSPPYNGDIASILGILYSGLGPAELDTWVRECVSAFNGHSALTMLGEALVHHLGNLSEAEDHMPEQLNRWFAAWENAAEGHPEFAIPMRLLRAGVRYLQSPNRDESILLDLKSDERELLKQAFGLEEQ